MWWEGWRAKRRENRLREALDSFIYSTRFAAQLSLSVHKPSAHPRPPSLRSFCVTVTKRVLVYRVCSVMSTKIEPLAPLVDEADCLSLAFTLPVECGGTEQIISVSWRMQADYGMIESPVQH